MLSSRETTTNEETHAGPQAAQTDITEVWLHMVRALHMRTKLRRVDRSGLISHSQATMQSIGKPGCCHPEKERSTGV